MNDKIVEKFSNNHYCLVTIFDHLVECTERYKRYKLTDLEPQKTFKKQELTRELMDLLILLEVYKENNENVEKIYAKRIERFIEKIQLDERLKL